MPPSFEQRRVVEHRLHRNRPLEHRASSGFAAIFASALGHGQDEKEAQLDHRGDGDGGGDFERAVVEWRSAEPGDRHRAARRHGFDRFNAPGAATLPAFGFRRAAGGFLRDVLDLGLDQQIQRFDAAVARGGDDLRHDAVARVLVGADVELALLLHARVFLERVVDAVGHVLFAEQDALFFGDGDQQPRVFDRRLRGLHLGQVDAQARSSEAAP